MSRRDASNPLWRIIDEADALLTVFPRPVSEIPPDLLNAYRENVLVRHTSKDVFERLSAIAAAFDRLCILNRELMALSEAGHAEHLRIGPHTWLTDPGMDDDHEHHWAEVDMATSFVLYEMDSLTTILRRSFGINFSDGSEVTYAIKIRDRLLAHPELHGVNRIPGRPGSYGGAGPVVLGAGLSGRFTERYLMAGITDLSTLPPEGEIEEIRRSNEATIRSRTRNERLSDEQKLRLVAFGARDPNVIRAVDELADVIVREFMPRVSDAVHEAVSSFGAERPENPGPAIVVSFAGFAEADREP